MPSAPRWRASSVPHVERRGADLAADHLAALVAHDAHVRLPVVLHRLGLRLALLSRADRHPRGVFRRERAFLPPLALRLLRRGALHPLLMSYFAATDCRYRFKFQSNLVWLNKTIRNFRLFLIFNN